MDALQLRIVGTQHQIEEAQKQQSASAKSQIFKSLIAMILAQKSSLKKATKTSMQYRKEDIWLSRR